MDQTMIHPKKADILARGRVHAPPPISSSAFDATEGSRLFVRSSRLYAPLLFFVAVLIYLYAAVDPRLIFHWQGPAFYTHPGYLTGFLKYPGGPADYFSDFIAQVYVSRLWGAAAITAQLAAAWALTNALFKALSGRRTSLAGYVPSLLLLFHASLYYERTPLSLALLVGLGFALLYQRGLRGCRNEFASLSAYLFALGLAYWLAGLAILFFAPLAVAVRWPHLAAQRRLKKTLVVLTYLSLAAAAPLLMENGLRVWPSIPSVGWFRFTDRRMEVISWGLYLFFAFGAAIAVRRPQGIHTGTGLARKRKTRSRKSDTHRLPRALRLVAAYGLPLLAAIGVMAYAYSAAARDRRLAALDYHVWEEDWPAALRLKRELKRDEYNPLSLYQLNLALHESGRMGDEMFSLPQTGSLLLAMRAEPFLPYMLHLTDMCLRLGRLNEAERFGSEAMVFAGNDPRVCRLLAMVYLVKGQPEAARKFLTILAANPPLASWASSRLRDLDQDPLLQHNAATQHLRRRMLRIDDMLPVWQRAGMEGPDIERLLLDQLDQDPTNRMAFEFLMGAYLLARDLKAARALMPRIQRISGSAYQHPDGRRRTPRHYQEAMAIYNDLTGTSDPLPGLEMDSETLNRLAVFKRLVSQAGNKQAAIQAAWDGFRNTYFFYFAFGPEGYQ